MEQAMIYAVMEDAHAPTFPDESNW